MNFKELGLGRQLCSTLYGLEYHQPTRIQTEAIPEALAGNDVLGIAQTGTGKTGAFCLPILEMLLDEGVKARSRHPRVLIISPTRELATQIRGEVSRYVAGTSIRHACITGGVSQRPQEKTLSQGVEVLVATPGRLLDLMTNHLVVLDDVTHLVLDEADRLLDMGFVRDIKRIVSRLPKQRQSLLFSATMPREVEKLASQFLSRPVRLEVTPRVVTVEKVEQGLVSVATSDKQDVLRTLLTAREVRKAIVFTRTKHGANRVAKKLDKSGLGVEVVHGNKSQNARTRALDNFKNGDAWVLVATDVAARGIDIQDVTHVINFELPHEPEVYVHRIGRTARAGASGVAWSLVDPSEMGRLRAIERLTKVKPGWLDVGPEEVVRQIDEGRQQRSSSDQQADESTHKKTRTRRRRRRSSAKVA